MRSIAICLAFLNWPMFGGDARLPRARTGVYFAFAQQPGLLSSALRIEAESILSPLGFDLEWREAADSGKESWADLALVTFTGRCSLDPGGFPDFVPSALGWTDVVNGQIQPFVHISCDRIGGLLQSSLLLEPAKKREEMFQRALARVLAHELYHVFARNSTHGRSGVGKAVFNALDLLSSKFQFHKLEAQSLRESSTRAASGFSASGQ